MANYQNKANDRDFAREVIADILNSRFASEWKIHSPLGEFKTKGVALSTLELKIRSTVGYYFRSKPEQLKEYCLELGFESHSVSHSGRPITVIGFRPNMRVVAGTDFQQTG